MLISGSTTFAVIAYQNSDYDNQYLSLNDKITTGQSSIKKQQNTYSEILPSLSSKIKSKQLPTVIISLEHYILIQLHFTAINTPKRP